MIKLKNGIVSKNADLVKQPLRYIQDFLYIRDKIGAIRPFILNPLQKIYLRAKAKAILAGKKPRILVLKFRRGGITTLEQALSFHRVGTMENQETVTLAHDDQSTEKIFRISQLFYDKLEADMKPNRYTTNKRELNFNLLNSLFYIGTAGNKAFGRGQTLQRVHGAEVAWWKGKNEAIDNLVVGLTEAASHGEVVLETSPRGVGGWFHKTWMEAKEGGNAWTPIFLPWFIDPTNQIPLEPGEEIYPTDEERELVKKHGLFAEQIKWRRDKKAELGYLFPQEYPEDDVSAFISAGILFFDVDIVNALATRCKKPIEVRDNRQVTIWVKPKKNHKYVAGGDVGEGLPNSDYSGIGILDSKTGEQVARLHGRWRPSVYGEKAVKLCREYNNALLAIEANNHGHSALNTVMNTMHYKRIYYHKDYDEQTKKVKMKPGWQTNLKTRPIMLDGIEEAIRTDSMPVNDEGFLSECLAFQDNGTGKYEAAEGYHDDTIFMWGIAWQVRKMGHGAEPRVS